MSLPDRAELRQNFLGRAGWDDATLIPVSGDASFRSYYRLTQELDGEVETAILMDAPPPKESVTQFVKVAHWLVDNGFSAPHIIASDEPNGFLLLEDLGDDLYARIMAADPSSQTTLYGQAIDTLLALQATPLPADIPPYDTEVLSHELSLFTQWYCPLMGLHADAVTYQQCWRELLLTVQSLPKTLVLRDYHAENLLALPDRPTIANVGLLDFQDALIGSPAYDLVSLLEDARRDVPPHIQQEMLAYYLSKRPDLNEAAFREHYAILGAQRNLKIIGIFARLCLRDDKPRYLQFIPRVWGYVEQDLSHPSLAPVKHYLDALVPSTLRKQVPLPQKALAANG